MGNEHIFKLKQQIKATEGIKIMILFMFCPKERPKEAKYLDYKWIYPKLSHNFKHKERGIHIEIKDNMLIRFDVKHATNISWTGDMKRFIEILELRNCISLTISEEKIY